MPKNLLIPRVILVAVATVILYDCYVLYNNAVGFDDYRWASKSFMVFFLAQTALILQYAKYYTKQDFVVMLFSIIPIAVMAVANFIWDIPYIALLVLIPILGWVVQFVFVGQKRKAEFAAKEMV